MSQAPSLSALFRNTDEQPEPVTTKVIGDLPKWISGSYLKIGPGKFDLSKDFTVNHWFDGFALIYKFQIKDGKVSFIKKFLQSEAYKKAMASGKPVFTEFGTKAYTDSSKNLFSRMVSSVAPDLTDNTSQNLISFQDHIFATTESGALNNIDDNLEITEKVDLTKIVGVNLASSHFYKNSEGALITLGTSLLSGFKYHIIKVPPSSSTEPSEMFKKATTVTTISSRWKASAAYYHSFGMTDRYLVLIEQPLQVNGMKLISSQMKGRSMRECMEWTPEELNLFHIVDMKTGKVLPIKYRSSKAFCVFHHINTFEEEGQLVIDIIGQDSASIMDMMFLKNLRTGEFDAKDKASGRRFILPLGENIKGFPEKVNLARSSKPDITAIRTGDVITVTGAKLSEPGYEYPIINPSYFGKPYKYYYASGLFDASLYKNCIVKVNLETGEVIIWKDSGSSYPGEVQFVPCPGAKDEDDGVLITGVTDLRDDHSDFLVFLNAKDLTEIARAEVGCHVPNLVHSLFTGR